jgi:hypothetical protein
MTDWKKIISEWNTPAMAVFATELVCGKCHNEMGAVIFEKEESLNNFTQSNNEKLCESCVQELKKAVKDCEHRFNQYLVCQHSFDQKYETYNSKNY